MNEVEWSSLSKITLSPDLYDWPGVYKIRLIESNGLPHRIGRFLADDPEGLIVIGESIHVGGRLRDFIKGMESGKVHAEAQRLWFVINKAPTWEPFEAFNFQFFCKKCNSKIDAEMEEEKLLKTYFKQFGELPPLNHTLEDKYESWRVFPK